MCIFFFNEDTSNLIKRFLSLYDISSRQKFDLLARHGKRNTRLYTL